MSDFDDVVMPETPDPAPEPEAQPEPEAAPEAEKPIWEKYGFDSEEAFDKKVSNLSKWEREVNQKASEVGAKEKRMVVEEPEAPAIDPDADIWDELDPVVAKKLRAAVEKVARDQIASTVGPQAEVASELFNDSAAEAFDAFATKNDLDADELYNFMASNSLLPNKPSLQLLRTQMSLAANALKGEKVDAIVEKRLAEEMAKLKKDGAHVTAVEPAATKEPAEAEKDVFLGGSFLDKLKAVASGKE